MKNTLSIAGFDPSGGAGVIADCKTFHSFGVNGFAVNTATTFQNANHLYDVNWESESSIIRQIEPLFQQNEIQFAKIGLIENLDRLNNVIYVLRKFNPTISILWDTIFSSSSGFSIHSEIEKSKLEDVLSKIQFITPNQVELERILAILNLQSIEQIPVHSILRKGGHRTENQCIDELWKNRKLIHSVGNPRLEKGIHGSGCVFSSAFIANLTLEKSYEESFEIANRYLHELLKTSEGNLGQHHLVQL